MRRLALGTAQFGLDYGIANSAGKVDSTAVARILARARQSGMDTLDTAIAYGDSEARLGAAGVAGWRVITKLSALPADVVDVASWVETSIAGSLRRLGLASVDAVLLHRSSDLLGERSKALVQALDGLVSAGLATSVGVSIYDPSELDSLWPRWRPQMVQAPYNVLDRRLVNSGWLARLAQQGIRVHVRSVFLQGLLVMDATQRPAWFSPWAELLDRWHGWCGANAVTPQVAALAFVAAQEHVERFVMGIDSLQQLEQLLQQPAEVPLPPVELCSDDRELIEPSALEIVVKTIAIVQARMGSTRLPNKIMKPVLGTPMIELLLARLKRATSVDEIVLATSSDARNDPLDAHVSKLGFRVYRGSEQDVLDRYYQAALVSGADVVLRITGDCPLIDPALVDSVVAAFREKAPDYAGHVDLAHFPDGLDIEVFSFKALRQAWENAHEPREREHVTPYLRESGLFRKLNVLNREDLSGERWTVDEAEDFEVITGVFSAFGGRLDFTWQEVLDLRRAQPGVFSANRRHVRNEGALMGTGQKLWKRAKRTIPGGSMLLSKRAEMFLPEQWPAYYSRAKGCRVWDLDGREYIDMSFMGIGTNTLGYGHPEVDDAVRKVIDNGNMSTLNCPEEVYLAERLCELHPWAQMVHFARSGGEAVAIGVRIARAAAGKDKVAICGYHGWHDWYLAANLGDDRGLDGHLLPGLAPNGVPRSLRGSVLPFNYNRIDELEALIANHEIGVIVMEVSRNFGPADNFLQKIRDIATQRGIVLVFDECTSGFRQTFGGLHKQFGVDPDMALFGKTLGNGYAVTAVIGRSEVMEAAQTSFISSTFWTERIGSAAALKTLEVMERERSWERITATGTDIAARWQALASRHGLRIKPFGLPALCGYTFDSQNGLAYKTLVTQEMLAKGYLAGTATYSCLEHTPRIVDDYFSALEPVFALLAECENGRDVLPLLKGPICHAGFGRLN